jgi:hypothetical protein
MDERPIIWDATNRKHLGEDHPERHITFAEIEEALSNPERVEAYQENRKAYQCIGRTKAGRWPVIAWIDDPDGRYPFHARAASRRIIRRLTE